MQKRSVMSVALLSIFTCGIYTIFWMFTSRTELKCYLKDESINPGLEVLICILCFPYQYYWFYKYSKDIVRAELKAGNAAPADNSAINLLLSIFGLGLVSMLIIQGQINEIVDRPQ